MIYDYSLTRPYIRNVVVVPDAHRLIDGDFRTVAAV